MPKKPLIAIVIFLIFSVVILLNNTFAPLQVFTGFVQGAFSSPKAFIHGVITGGEAEDTEEVERLKQENRQLSQKLLEFERTMRDNEALRSQFEEGSDNSYEMLPANVIGFLGKFSNPTSLIIDKGENDGIMVGMAVVVGDNLIGKISKSSGRYSEALLITSPSFSALARASESNAPGIINGASDFVLLTRVDVNESLVEGEFLLSKGEINDRGFGIPPDLIIGKISSINRSESLPNQSAKIESDIQFSKLDTVFIVKSL